MDISIDKAIPERTPRPKPDLRKTMLPLGPIVVFGASNFPFAYSTAGGDTASALAAGCPVIVKSHPMHAGTGELVAGAIIRAAEKTGMPEGVFSNLNSKGIDVGVQLVQNPQVKGVGFTGSIKGGRALFDIASRRPEPIPVFAEMGSINPVIISPLSLLHDKEKWADKYADSITTGTGQFCTNPGLILAIDSENLNEFGRILSKKITEKESTCMLHPNIKDSFSTLKRSILELDDVKQISVPVSTGKENYADQTVVMVKGDSFLENKDLHKEVFGPFSMIVACKDEDQLISIIDNLEGQLTGTIIALPEELNDFGQIKDSLQYRVGRIIYNGVPTGVEVCASMNHGGPYPATTDSRFTAVGVHSIRRWVRPIAYQNFPKQLLPQELQ
jgi:NADP-dependent aldehyde dehydrogenase